MASILSNQHRVLLANSEVTKEDPFLLKVINYDIEINDKNIKNFSPEEQQIIKSIPETIKIAETEWIGNPVPEIILDGDERINCSLCGTDNKLIFYIQNQRNGVKLNVGSRCITKFTIMENQGLNIKSIIREATKARRIKIIDARYPEVRVRLNHWRTKLNEFEIMIPNNIEKKYLWLGNEVSKIFDKYIKSNIKEPDLEIFQSLFKQADHELDKINEYVEIHKNDKNIVTKELEGWLKNHGFNHAITELKKTGTITINNAGYINEPSYMNKFAQKVNNLPGKPYLCSIDTKTLDYVLEIKGYEDIELHILPRYLIQSFGNFLFNNKVDINIKELLKQSKIIDIKSVSAFIKKSEIYLKQINAFISYSDLDNNTLTVGRLDEDIFVEINLGSYINYLKMIVFKHESLDIRSFKNFIFSRPQHTKKELDNIRYVYNKGRKAKYEY